MSMHYNCSCVLCTTKGPVSVLDFAMEKEKNRILEKKLSYMRDALSLIASGELPDGLQVDENVVSFCSSTLKYCETIIPLISAREFK